MVGFDPLFITSLSISYMPAKSETRLATAFALAQEVKARAAPNFQNRKWLNFQDKIDRKSKVSKLRLAVIVKIPTHDAIWPEDVALAVGQQTYTLVLHAQATHFSQGFKAYLSVKTRGDVFANPLERDFHAHAQKVVHQGFSFPGALGKHAKLGSAAASATGLHLTEKSGLAEFITMSALAHLGDCREMASRPFAICSLAYSMHARTPWASNDTHWAGSRGNFMYEVRRAEECGHTKLDWLDSRTRSLSDATTTKSTWDSVLIASSMTTALFQGRIWHAQAQKRGDCFE